MKPSTIDVFHIDWTIQNLKLSRLPIPQFYGPTEERCLNRKRRFFLSIFVHFISFSTPIISLSLIPSKPNGNTFSLVYHGVGNPLLPSSFMIYPVFCIYSVQLTTYVHIDVCTVHLIISLIYKWYAICTAEHNAQYMICFIGVLEQYFLMQSYCI